MGKIAVVVKEGVMPEHVKHAVSCVGDMKIISQNDTDVLLSHPDNRRDYIHALKVTGLFKSLEQEVLYTAHKKVN